MFRQIEPTHRNAVEAQALIRDHYVRLGIWTVSEVRKYIANPDDSVMVDLQLKGLASPASKRSKAGNARPVYGGVYDGTELTALLKAGEYRSPARILADEPAYMNIHELVVADSEQYAAVVAQSLEFGRNVLKIHPDQQASVEVFSLDDELEPYFANRFEIAAYDTQSYSFGSQTEATVHRLVRPNLRPQ